MKRKPLAWMSLLLVSALTYAEAPPTEKQEILTLPPPRDPTFALQLYQPNYMLPVSLSGSLNHAATSGAYSGQSLQPEEMSFQLSVKTPVLSHFYGKNNALYFAYSQLSFWQAYRASPFFRESNYQPEIFLENLLDKRLSPHWSWRTLDIGAMHQSNGQGGSNERSWNRIYAAGHLSNDQWRLMVKPWYVIPDASLREHNPDISHYLGHGQLWLAYHVDQNVLAISTYGMENAPHRVTVVVTWSKPLVGQFSAYAQIFTGYGQSLLQYNHHVNSLGLGIALSNWL